MELKDIVKDHLVETKEKEKQERIKRNSKSSKFTVYVNKNVSFCKTVINFLQDEGYNFVKKEISKNQKEWNEVASTINLGFTPTIYANGVYLVYQRDFQNIQQLAAGLLFLTNPTFKNSTSKEKTVEHIKTTQYNILNRINNLEKNLNPLINFLTTLQQQLEEEDK